jgi:RNA polymerase sigma-70 factor (ECF subfamily)
MEWMAMDDAAAVARVRGGDRDAFRLLVDRHSRDVFRLAFRMMGNEQDADDVVQETFLRAYRSLDRFEERSQFGTWVYRIAVNRCYDMLEKRNRGSEQRVEKGREEDEASLEDRIASDQPTPERMLLSQEVRGKVQKVLDELTALERTAFVMRHFEGKPMQEIAKSLGVQSSAAKQSVFRAVRKLRRELEPLRALR